MNEIHHFSQWQALVLYAALVVIGATAGVAISCIVIPRLDRWLESRANRRRRGGA